MEIKKSMFIGPVLLSDDYNFDPPETEDHGGDTGQDGDL